MQILKLAAIGLVSALGLSTAQAELVRTFVATYGNDSNPCTPDAPCRTFPAAITATSAGGTVIALNSGGYGSDITIAKSISIIAPEGVVAQIKSASFGVTINGSGITVTLQGLYISGAGTGVQFTGGKSVTLEKLTIQGLYAGAVNQAPGGLMSISQTNVDNASFGFYAAGSSQGVASISIVNSRVTNASNAYSSGSYSNVSVKNSVAHGQSQNSSICLANFYATGSSGSAYIEADDVQSTGCNQGFLASTGGVISVSNASITGNAGAGKTMNTGQAVSFGNNKSYGNVDNALTGFGAATQR